MHQTEKTVLGMSKKGGFAPFESFSAFCFPDSSDSFLFMGTACLSFGAWMIYPPAAYIVAGGVFMFLSFVSAGVNNGAA